MFLVQFHELFPAQASQEALVIELEGAGGEEEDFVVQEAYCPDPDCECRKVTLNVIHAKSGEQIATINHFFDEFEQREQTFPTGIEEQTYLDPLNPQSKWSDHLLTAVKEVLRESQYGQILQQHYQMVKDSTADVEDLATQTESDVPDAGWEPFFEGNDVIDEAGYVRQVNTLLEEFSKSPEFDQLKQKYPTFQVRWVHWLFDTLFDYERRELDELDPAFLDWLLLDHTPRKLSSFDIDGERAVDELQGFFEFLHRVKGYDNAAACAEFLATKGLGEHFEEAMADESRFGMAKTLLYMGQEAGFDMTDQEDVDAFVEVYNTLLSSADQHFSQQPFRKESPEVGRNAPCPCGSGKKHKKCCMRRFPNRP